MNIHDEFTSFKKKFGTNPIFLYIKCHVYVP